MGGRGLTAAILVAVALGSLVAVAVWSVSDERYCRVVLHLEPVDEEGRPVKGTFTVIIFNVTRSWLERKHSDLVDMVYIGSERTVVLKVFRNRRPPLYPCYSRPDTTTYIWEDHQYIVHMLNERYSGGAVVLITPSEPYIERTVRVVVHRNPVAVPAYSPMPYQGLYCEEAVDTRAPLPAVQVHSIVGVSVYLVFKRGNYLFYTARCRYIWEDLARGETSKSPWLSLGPMATFSEDETMLGPMTNGAKRWLGVDVKYRYERWLTAWGSGWLLHIENVYPVSFGGGFWTDYIRCPYCGGKVVGDYKHWTAPLHHAKVWLEPGVPEVEVFNLVVRFSLSYGPITITVELWKLVGRGLNAEPPHLEIRVSYWYGDELYAFDAGSGWKIVHFTWRGCWSGPHGPI